MKSSRKQKRKLLREFFEKIIVINEYEIKLVLRKASDSGALLFDVIMFRNKYSYEDTELIKKLYVNKGMSLRKIASKLNCSRTTIYKRLISEGIEISYTVRSYKKLTDKAQKPIESGDSYQAISDKFNIWKVPTRTGQGKWHPKTIRDLVMKSTDKL